MTHKLDAYGGFTALKGTQTGWFHLEELNGRTWFITPEGNAFFPLSLAHLFTGYSIPTVQNLYDGDQEAWMEDWFAKARSLGFNCALAGVTSQCRDPKCHVDVDRAEAIFHREMFPFAAGLFLVPHPDELSEGQERPDISASAFLDWAEDLIVKVCDRYVDDPLMMGYYYGFGSFVRPKPWMASMGRDVSDEKLQENIREMALGLYSFAHKVIRKHDPHHLILGPYVKEQSFDSETWKALSPYVDVLSPQHLNRAYSFSEQALATGRPILVSDETTGHLHNADHPEYHSLKSSHGKGRIYESVLERHLRDRHVCGVSFCATTFDLDEGPLMARMGLMEGLYDAGGTPKAGLVDAVKRANQNVYARAMAPLGSDELHAMDARHFATWDEAFIVD